MEPAQGDQWPEGDEVKLSAVNYGEDYSMLQVSGGLNKDGKVLGEMQILNVLTVASGQR